MDLSERKLRASVRADQKESIACANSAKRRKRGVERNMAPQLRAFDGKFQTDLEVRFAYGGCQLQGFPKPNFQQSTVSIGLFGSGKAVTRKLDCASGKISLTSFQMCEACRC